MEPGIGLRREAAPDLEAIGSDPALAERLCDEIRRDGPMPFVRFMALALYDPDGGYYRGSAARPGRAGDFLTAPELHPIFSQTVATAIDQIRIALGDPRPFTIREYGAGTGALARPLLAELRDRAPDADLRYQPIEVDRRRLDDLARTLADAGLTDLLEPASTDPIHGVVLANEVLDALPVHRVRARAGRLRELAVTTDAHGAFTEVEIEPTTPALAARLAAQGIRLADGQAAEICLVLDDWIATAAAGLRRGVLLLIDYGAPAVELYDPRRRPDGTLMSYLRHRVSADPYGHVGRQDLTAHVDLTAVERAAKSAGLTTLGTTTQAEALMGLGIEERLRAVQTDPGTTAEAYLLLRAALMRLLDPNAMGRFRVMAFGRDWPQGGTPLGLFSYRLPDRTLPARTPPK